MTIDAYSAEEHQRVIDAEQRYGDYYVNAYNATIMLSNIMMWPVSDCDIFIRFLSQLKKYHTLSLISTVRLHRIQAKMNLRYFLESTVNAAYTLTHTDTKVYFNFDDEEQPDAKKASHRAYNWIENAFPAHSQSILNMKDQINKQTAHANIFNSQHNFLYVPGARAEIHTSYFDFEDEQFVKADLWQCAQAGLIVIDLILAVQKQHGGFLPSRDVEGLGELIANNDTLLDELETGLKRSNG